MTPRIPQNSTRCWYWRGMAKNEKTIAITNTLSMDSDFPIIEAGEVSIPFWRPSSHQSQPPKSVAAQM